MVSCGERSTKASPHSERQPLVLAIMVGCLLPVALMLSVVALVGEEQGKKVAPPNKERGCSCETEKQRASICQSSFVHDDDQ
jgi:hypothetical protein